MQSIRSLLSEKGEKVLHHLRARLSARAKRRLRNFLGFFGWRQQRPLLHLYPIDIPEIEIKPGLDFLLLELPPRYMPMMPNGLAYVDLILRNSGVAHQTIDTNIIMYHRFHQARLLHGAQPVLPSGRPAPEDPWDNTLEAEWHAGDFIEFFWPQLQEILDKIVAARPKAVGISLNGFNRRLAERFIAALREAAPDILIVVGGYDCVYANVGPRLFKNYDYMIIGEGENSMPPLLEAIREGRRPGDLPGIFSAYDLPGTPFVPCELPQNLDLDSPRYDWVSHALYQTYGRLHMVPLTASRGCNWGKCRFCAECFSFRKRSPRHVADEIEYWTRLGFHTFHFNESDVNGDHANLHGICTEIIERGLSISCVGQLRIDRRNTPEYFKHLAKAGFKHLRFGVDGWSRNTLRLQCKGYVMETVHANIKACAASGIRTTVNIVIGVPGETDADVAESIGHIRALKGYLDEVESLNTLILAAGSEYMKNPDKYRIRFRGDKDAILAEHPYFIPSELWYSEEPYIDQAVRMERLNRICLELDASGVAIGPFARKIVERLKGVADVSK